MMVLIKLGSALSGVSFSALMEEKDEELCQLEQAHMGSLQILGVMIAKVEMPKSSLKGRTFI